MPSDTDIAWLAGLFEGEGNLAIGKNGATRATIRMTDLDVIQRVDALFPSGNKIQVVQPKVGKTQYAWRLGKPDKMREFLGMIIPFLGERRLHKANEVLNHLDTRLGTGGWHRAKTHCSNGHEYTPDNTIYRPGTTHRRCRICVAQWADEAKARKKAS